MIKQLDLPQTGPDVAGMLKRRANAPLKPKAPQQSCNVGLFGDDSRQSESCRAIAQAEQGARL
jgi:hypothetical protein